MKRALFSLMMTWFVFHANSEKEVVKFLNKLPAKTDFRIVATAISPFENFNVFYNADVEVK